MGNRFLDKVVFITGASAGIGAEMARQFAREGARVALVARRRDRLADAQREILDNGGRAEIFVGDVTDRAAMDAAVADTLQAFGRIDIAVANAGFGVIGPVYRLGPDDYRRQFETNFFGVINTLYAALEPLRQTQGRLVIIGSVAGMVATPSTSAYCASKFAVIGLAHSIYHDLDELGVSLTLINPGFVQSEIRSINNYGEHTGKPEPLPKFWVLPTAAAARQILSAVYRGRTEAIVTFHGKVFAWSMRAFPRLTRFLLRRLSKGRLPKYDPARCDKSAGD